MYASMLMSANSSLICCLDRCQKTWCGHSATEENSSLTLFGSSMRKKVKFFPFLRKVIFPDLQHGMCAYRCSAYIKRCCMKGETGSKSRFILFSFTTVSPGFDSLNTSEAMQSDRIWDPFLFCHAKKRSSAFFHVPTSKTKCYFHIESICKYELWCLNLRYDPNFVG